MSPDLHSEATPRASDKAARKLYVAPLLEVYGAVSELTHTSGAPSPSNDAGIPPINYASALP